MVCSHGVPPCSSALLCVLLLVFIVTMTTGEIRRNEETCLRQGGICVEKGTCPDDKMVNKTGMCPEQEDRGSVCCYAGEIRRNEEACLRQGGICVEKGTCPDDKMVNKTGMCPEQEDRGSVCCYAVLGKIRANEEPCLREGGMCVEKETCPEDKRVNKTGMCPEQEERGAVCCHAVPDTSSCQQHGGHCLSGEDACQHVRSFGRLDCKEGNQCCLLIY